MVSSSNYGEKSQIKNGRMFDWYCDIGLWLFIIMDIFWRNKKHSSKLWAETPQYLAIIEWENLWQQKAKNAFFNLRRRWNLSINVRDWNVLLVPLYLRVAFRVCIFPTFCYVGWATLSDVAFSGYHKWFCSFMSVQAAFKISTKLVAFIVAQWRGHEWYAAF